MAITNASRVADFGSGIGTEGAVLQIDNTNKRIGIGTTNPQAMLQVGTAVTVYGNSGIVSATTFVGNLTGDASGSSGSCSGNAATATLASGLTGSPNITINNLVGVAATFSGVVTYEDVTNVDSVGLITARSGIEFGASGVGGTITAVGNAEFVGIVTARSGIEFGAAGVGGTITAVGNAEFAGITTASKFSGPGNIPQNIQAGSYTLVASDAGKHIFASGNINTGADNVFSVGDAVTIVNNTASDLTITRAITTMYNSAAGDVNSATYTLAARGMATILFVAGDEARISGAGLS